MTAPASDQILLALFTEIGIIDQLVRARLEAVLPDGLLLSHFVMLNHLARIERPTSPVELAQALQVTKGAITNTLQRLEERRLIAVLPHPTDRRGKRVALTAAGTAARDRCLTLASTGFSELEAAVGAEALAALVPPLRRLREYLDGAR